MKHAACSVGLRQLSIDVQSVADGNIIRKRDYKFIKSWYGKLGVLVDDILWLYQRASCFFGRQVSPFFRPTAASTRERYEKGRSVSLLARTFRKPIGLRSPFVLIV